MKVILLLMLTVSMFLGTVFAQPVSNELQSPAKTHFVDEQIMIVSDIKNGQEIIQNFAYITQVTDENRVVVSLSWLTGQLSPKQAFSPAQSWTPSEPGTYKIEVFVWESIDNPEALSPPLSMIVNVVHKSM